MQSVQWKGTTLRRRQGETHFGWAIDARQQISAFVQRQIHARRALSFVPALPCSAAAGKEQGRLKSRSQTVSRRLGRLRFRLALTAVQQGGCFQDNSGSCNLNLLLGLRSVMPSPNELNPDSSHRETGFQANQN